MTLQDELRRIADMLDSGEYGFLTGGLSVTAELEGVTSIRSDLRLLQFGGSSEPTMFVTEYLILGDDGPTIVRHALSEWPEWADSLRRMMTPNAELCGGPSGPSERAPG